MNAEQQEQITVFASIVEKFMNRFYPFFDWKVISRCDGWDVDLRFTAMRNDFIAHWSYPYVVGHKIDIDFMKRIVFHIGSVTISKFVDECLRSEETILHSWEGDITPWTR